MTYNVFCGTLNLTQSVHNMPDFTPFMRISLVDNPMFTMTYNNVWWDVNLTQSVRTCPTSNALHADILDG